MYELKYLKKFKKEEFIAMEDIQKDDNKRFCAKWNDNTGSIDELNKRLAITQIHIMDKSKNIMQTRDS